MSVPAAFLGVVLTWATTPLATKWSSEGAGFLFGVASRTVPGVVVCLVLVVLFLGQEVNGETISPRELVGTAVILSGLACYQWEDRWLERRA